MNTKSLLPLSCALSVACLAVAGCNDVPVSAMDTVLEAANVETSAPLSTNQVDILWVVDSSGSMEAEQAELTAQFDVFITELVNIGADFHMSVITTDMDDINAGRFLRGPWLESAIPSTIELPDDLSHCYEGEARTEDATTTMTSAEFPFLRRSQYLTEDGSTVDEERLKRDFTCIASPGKWGDSTEQGFNAVLRAFSDELLGDGRRNGDFIRDDAYLLVIFLTDEDDCSPRSGQELAQEARCYISDFRENLIDPAQVYDRLVELKGGDPSRVLMGGIIGPEYTPPEGETYPPANGDVVISDYRPPASCISAIATESCDESTPCPLEGQVCSPEGLCVVTCSTDDECIDSGFGDVCDPARARCVDRDVQSLNEAKDGLRYRELLALATETSFEESICSGSFEAALRELGLLLRDNVDLRCLLRPPETCETDGDCSEGVSCIDPGAAGGFSYCSDLEIGVEVRDTENDDFVSLVSPGTVGEMGTPREGAEFTLEFGDTCPWGASIIFSAGARPGPGGQYRVTYPIDLELEQGSNE